MDLADLQFESNFVRELPADPVPVNVPRQVRNASYTRVAPTPVSAPRLLAWSDALGGYLRISRPSPEAIEILAGNKVLPGMQPYAARYGGHQFGVWAGQLGDGRAITLGEVIAADGARQELQLKGAGRTPYARTADGRAVLRSSLREFLCSEAMHFLGVPTTRALSLVATGDAVMRDMFYDGNPQDEPGAVVCRVAPSFVRFGNFQIHVALGEEEPLKRLHGYVVRNYYPDHEHDWFHVLCKRTALLIVDWMRLGFVHGVMNTDNMSILGITIDYGPYGWLEGYDPSWTPNTTDAGTRRYCYGNQPEIALWNLARLAEALLPLQEKEHLEAGLALYAQTYEDAMRTALAQKLGFASFSEESDNELIGDFFKLLAAVETDWTIFCRNLAHVDETPDDTALVAPLEPAFYTEVGTDHRATLVAWLRRYLARVNREAPGRAERMNRVNPKYVPRNYLAQQAIDAIEQRGDTSVLEKLMKVLERPYDEQPENEDLAARRPEWARNRPGCSALSCSS
jgi:uncharacterized protein YdiU (UPF0061 family)